MPWIADDPIIRCNLGRKNAKMRQQVLRINPAFSCLSRDRHVLSLQSAASMRGFSECACISFIGPPLRPSR